MIEGQVILSNKRAEIWAGYYFDAKRLRNDSITFQKEIKNRDTAIIVKNVKIQILQNEIQNDTTIKNNYKNLYNKEVDKLDKKDKWNKVFKNISFTEFVIIALGVLLLVLKVI